MQLFARTHFDFIGKRRFFYAISGALMLASVASLVIKGGPKLSIDFTGGTVIQLAFKQPVPMKDLRDYLAGTSFQDAELQAISEGKSVIIRLPKSDAAPSEVGQQLQKVIAEKFPNSIDLQQPLERAEYVGPAVGRALASQALRAIIWSMVLIIIYVAFRFRSTLWGVCSVMAMFHDVISIVGIFSMLNKEISVTVVAAILTLAGYSMNDTIVIYDRMRENLRLSRKESLGDIINRSINETLSRSIMTSVTVAVVVAVLFFFGGSVIHDFAFALLWGVFVGSYSTIFVAAPIIYDWQSRDKTKPAVKNQPVPKGTSAVGKK